MGSDFIHVKLGAAVGFVLCSMMMLYDWARKEKAKPDISPDERFSWTLIQVIAFMVSITFIGIFILVLAILEALKGGM